MDFVWLVFWGAAAGLSGLIRGGQWGQYAQQVAPRVALAVRTAQPLPSLRVSLFNPCRRAAKNEIKVQNLKRLRNPGGESTARNASIDLHRS